VGRRGWEKERGRLRHGCRVMDAPGKTYVRNAPIAVAVNNLPFKCVESIFTGLYACASW